jgi:hypothetical protein
MDPPEAGGTQAAASAGRVTERKTIPFTFDKSYWSAGPRDEPNYCSQQTLFLDLGVELLDHAFNGFNACILACECACVARVRGRCAHVLQTGRRARASRIGACPALRCPSCSSRVCRQYDGMYVAAVLRRPPLLSGPEQTGPTRASSRSRAPSSSSASTRRAPRTPPSSSWSRSRTSRSTTRRRASPPPLAPAC